LLSGAGAASAVWGGKPAVTSTARCYAVRRWLRGNAGRRRTAGARPNYSVREDAAARGIAPERLHREGTSSHGLVGRCCAPVALVAVLRAAPVEPAPVRELVGDRLGQLVPLDDRDAVGGARGA